MNPAVESDSTRSKAETWFERQLAAAQRGHGKHWPEHREWVESYLREQIRQREAEVCDGL